MKYKKIICIIVNFTLLYYIIAVNISIGFVRERFVALYLKREQNILFHYYYGLTLRAALYYRIRKPQNITKTIVMRRDNNIISKFH